MAVSKLAWFMHYRSSFASDQRVVLDFFQSLCRDRLSVSNVLNWTRTFDTNF